MTEEWRRTHHPDYDVSNLGRVRSHKFGRRTILKGSTHVYGYPMVVFYPEVQGHAVHRLVARAFLGPVPPGQETMHKDDNPANCRWDNLEYGTHLQNMRDCIRRGRQTRRNFSDAEVRAIRRRLESLRLPTPARRLPSGTSQKLADEYGVSERCIEALWWGHNYANA